MPQKKSKGKRQARKEKKKGSAKILWLRIVIFMIIVLCGFVYLRARYGSFYPPLKALKKPFQADTIAVDLYFADPERDGLKAEQRDIPSDSSLSEMISHTLHELIRGPRGNLINAIPENTQLEDVRMEKDGVVWVDFSSPLSRAHPGGSSAEIMTVYSIVNTIVLNFKEVEKVRILIDGATIDTLAGHIDCSRPFVADSGLIH